MICGIKRKYLDHSRCSCTSAFVYKFRICRSDYEAMRADEREREAAAACFVYQTQFNAYLIILIGLMMARTGAHPEVALIN